jgi:transcription-repair coupling factor (superfamily II helicase)
MQLPDILDRVLAQPPVAGLLSTIDAQSERRIRVAPLIGAARPALIAALAQQLRRSMLVVAARLDQAARLREDLCQWLHDEQVLLLPAADALPYEHMSQGAEVIAERLRVLQVLRSWQPDGEDVAAPLIVTTIKALLQPTLTPDELARVIRSIKVGQQLDPRSLLQHWSDLGYTSVAAVEAPGEISSRGGIIDIWPYTDAEPLRIEFFGDEIDSMRRFDPLSQRSGKRVKGAEIMPPHEIPFWKRDRAMARLHALDTTDLRSEVLSEWRANIERLEHGSRFEGRAFYAPFFFDDPLPAIVQHLPIGTPMLLTEAREIVQGAAELDQQGQENYAQQRAAREIPAGVPRPYLVWRDVVTQIADRPLLDLSSQPADDPTVRGDQATVAISPTLFAVAERFGGQLTRAFDDIARRTKAGEQVVIVSPQAGRMRELGMERGLIGENQEPRTENQEEDEEEQRTENREQGNKGTTEQRISGSQPLAPSPQSLVVLHGTLSEGWHSRDLGLTLYTDNEIFGFQPRRPIVTRRKRQQREIDRQAFLQTLQPGDHVVHVEHGIAIYEGLRRINVEGIEREYLHLRYAAGDVVYVPVDQIDRVSKYIGSAESIPALSRLGTADWERVKRRVKAAVEELARELLDLYAVRQLAERSPYPPDSQWQHELEDAFPYVETDDQLQAIDDIKRDLQTGRPMDRLICGDVGYGKTEVAIRGAFKVVQDGKQVAVLVPTTVLAQQHYDTFRKRMAAFPVTVEMLSRFRSPKEQKAILERLENGSIDIIVGTHRLLSKDVQMPRLGLLIVDEEQRFGVRHKERLKQLRNDVDSLTLTATPIPRTLHMAMAGLRDLSIIDTPPEDRVPIKTYVVPFDENLVRESILREIGRGGQVYVVHNRVQSIYSFADRLQQLVPEARFLVGHGQLEEKELERVMLQFFEGEADVLVCTTIIESGLDLPRANTIIIDDATNYGLAQLYQLRGRVGRSTQRAYAYLLYHPGKRITGDAQQRLEAIQEATELGAGFRIAMRDLEIRGTGNLLGSEQAGHIGAVGFDLYTRLLAQAVETRKAEQSAAFKRERRTQIARSAQQTEQLRRASATKLPVGVGGNGDGPITPIQLVTLDLPLTAYLPTDYISDDTLRLRVYQKLVQATTTEEIRQLRNELKDRFGPIPQAAEHLLLWLELKALALRAGVPSISTGEDEFTIRLPANGAVDRRALEQQFRREASDGIVRIGPQFVRINRRAVGERWVETVRGVLETLGRSAGG